MRVRYLIGPATSVDSNDRGLAYGDGLFETMAVRRGSIRRLALHLARLASGCERLELPLPDLQTLTRRLGGQAAGIETGFVKLILTRGPGARGYAPPVQPEPTVILTAGTLAPPAPEISLATLATRLGENEKLAGIKHLCRLEQVLGQLELRQIDADEGLMLSTSGAVIGGTSRNLFAVFGRRVVTPGLSRAGIEGVMRRAVLASCHAQGIDAGEDRLDRSALDAADELFVSNALVGIQSVTRLDGRALPSRAMSERLRAALAEETDD